MLVVKIDEGITYQEVLWAEVGGSLFDGRFSDRLGLVFRSLLDSFRCKAVCSVDECIYFSYSLPSLSPNQALGQQGHWDVIQTKVHPASSGITPIPIFTASEICTRATALTA